MVERTSIMVLAQEGSAGVCGGGEGRAADRRCQRVLERTGNELLARASGYGTTLIRVARIAIVVLLPPRLPRGTVTRFGGPMEKIALAERVGSRPTAFGAGPKAPWAHVFRQVPNGPREAIGWPPSALPHPEVST